MLDGYFLLVAILGAVWILPFVGPGLVEESVMLDGYFFLVAILGAAWILLSP